MCSWDSDFGSMLSGCKANNVHPLPPEKLKDMLDISMSPNNAKMFGDEANTLGLGVGVGVGQPCP